MARSTRPVRRLRKKSNPVPAILGFLVFFAVLVYIGAVVVSGQKASNLAIHEYKKERAALAASAEARKEQALGRRKELVAQLKTLQAENLELKQQIQMTEKKLEKTREELAETAKKKEQLTEKVELQAEDKELTGESVDELLTKVTKLKRGKNALLSRYKPAYVDMKAELRRLVNQNDPEQVQMFFFTNRSTAFGPAAAFFAADLFYQKKQTRQATSLYETIVQQFPDSAYADQARTRLADIKARYDYDIYSTAGFYPYKIPDSLDFGIW